MMQNVTYMKENYSPIVIILIFKWNFFIIYRFFYLSLIIRIDLAKILRIFFKFDFELITFDLKKLLITESNNWFNEKNESKSFSQNENLSKKLFEYCHLNKEIFVKFSYILCHASF